MAPVELDLLQLAQSRKPEACVLSVAPDPIGHVHDPVVAAIPVRWRVNISGRPTHTAHVTPDMRSGLTLRRGVCHRGRTVRTRRSTS